MAWSVLKAAHIMRILSSLNSQRMCIMRPVCKGYASNHVQWEILTNNFYLLTRTGLKVVRAGADPEGEGQNVARVGT